MSQYTALATRARDTIARKGAPVTFTSANAGRVYDEDTGLWTGGGSVSATGVAVDVGNDVERFQALGLTLNTPVTLLVAAHGLALTPSPGVAIEWAGRTYATKYVEPVAPDGGPIVFTVIGDR